MQKGDVVLLVLNANRFLTFLKMDKIPINSGRVIYIDRIRPSERFVWVSI